MVAIAATDMDETQVRRLHRLLAGELLPAALLEDPDEPGSLILRDATTDTGCFLRLVHRGEDGEIVPGAPPGSWLDSWTAAAADALKIDADGSPPAPRRRAAMGDSIEIAAGTAIVLLCGAAILSWLGVRGLSGVVGIVALIVLALACFSGIAAEAGKQREIVR